MITWPIESNMMRLEVLKYRKTVLLTNKSFSFYRYDSLCTQNTIFQDTFPFHFYSKWVVMRSWTRGCYFESICKSVAVYTKNAYWGDSGIALLLCFGIMWDVSGQITTSGHWIGGWVGPRAGLHVLKKGKTLAPTINRTPDHTAHSLVIL
jgi:hypothetical protein